MEEYAKDMATIMKRYMPSDNVKYYSWCIQDLKFELSHIHKKILKYKTDVYMYNYIKMYVEPSLFVSILDDMDERSTEINYRIFKDIDWLNECINKYVVFHNQNDLIRYENIQEKFAKIKELYTYLTEEEQFTEMINLDYFFYYNDVEFDLDLEKQKEILKEYEGFAYYIVNRFEEYEFDVNNYSTNFENDMNYKKDLLEFLIKYHNVKN